MYSINCFPKWAEREWFLIAEYESKLCLYRETIKYFHKQNIELSRKIRKLKIVRVRISDMITKAQQEDAVLDVVESYRCCDEVASAIYDDGRSAEKMAGQTIYITTSEKLLVSDYNAEGKEEGKLVRLVDELIGEKTLEVKLKTSCY